MMAWRDHLASRKVRNNLALQCSVFSCKCALVRECSLFGAKIKCFAGSWSCCAKDHVRLRNGNRSSSSVSSCYSHHRNRKVMSSFIAICCSLCVQIRIGLDAPVCPISCEPCFDANSIEYREFVKDLASCRCLKDGDLVRRTFEFCREQKQMGRN